MSTTFRKSTNRHEVIHLGGEFSKAKISGTDQPKRLLTPTAQQDRVTPMYLHLRCHISKSCTQYFPASFVDGVWVKSASTYPGYSRSEASTERVIVTSDGLVPLSPTLQIINSAGLGCQRLVTMQQLQKDAKKVPVSAVQPQMQAPKWPAQSIPIPPPQHSAACQETKSFMLGSLLTSNSGAPRGSFAKA